MNTAAEAGTSHISDHLFAPSPEHQRQGHWWERCATCGLGAAAHKASAVALSTHPAPPYRCPDCVVQNRSKCVHQFMREGKR